MCECMRIARLHQSSLLRTRLILCVIHEDLTGNVRERRIKAARDQDAAVIQTDRHRVRLQGQILGYLLLGPNILVEVVVKNEILVVGISEEVDFGDWLEFIVKILVSVSIGELYHWVL